MCSKGPVQATCGVDGWWWAWWVGGWMGRRGGGGGGKTALFIVKWGLLRFRGMPGFPCPCHSAYLTIQPPLHTPVLQKTHSPICPPSTCPASPALAPNGVWRAASPKPGAPLPHRPEQTQQPPAAKVRVRRKKIGDEVEVQACPCAAPSCTAANLQQDKGAARDDARAVHAGDGAAHGTQQAPPDVAKLHRVHVGLRSRTGRAEHC
jgi:hypothetical protein